MKKSNLVKLFSILLMSVMVIMFSTCVLAADENGFNQLTLNSGSNTNSTNTNNQGNTSSTNSTSNTNSVANNTNTNTNTNRNSINNTNNTNNNTNNSSVYNNTNLPKTGIEDSIPVAMLVVIFGISAVYAYKKIKDYRDI